ncbi:MULTISPECIES: exopolysaccharide biosynthesis protein [Ensifer]|uniref:exopolysaccharide biosynthesis protein n=1 Tax=Ensifer TaxID=106591 RepID=UPI000DC53B41|nr:MULTISPECIES: exopolysaccharide biosynthesis protein [Ensifer]MCY1745133.1 exopolysaccharide biosynthesis protein [Ensifer sp. SL37]RAS01407.1 exopolysaccharide synthesis protein ExoD [Ensifer adhaerens]
MTNTSADSDQNHERAHAAALEPMATAIVEDILAYCSDRDRVSVGEVINRLGSSGLAVSVLMLVLPARLPIPGPYPPVLAIAMIALALILKDGLALIIAFVAAMLAAACIGGLMWFGNEFLVPLFSFWQVG